MTDKKKVEFAPGCFDTFDGTQDELAELMAHITELVESGQLATEFEELFDEDEIGEIEIRNRQSRTLQ